MQLQNLADHRRCTPYSVPTENKMSFCTVKPGFVNLLLYTVKKDLWLECFKSNTLTISLTRPVLLAWSEFPKSASDMDFILFPNNKVYWVASPANTHNNCVYVSRDARKCQRAANARCIVNQISTSPSDHAAMTEFTDCVQDRGSYVYVEYWVGSGSVLCPRQHSIGYMGDGEYTCIYFTFTYWLIPARLHAWCTLIHAKIKL